MATYSMVFACHETRVAGKLKALALLGPVSEGLQCKKWETAFPADTPYLQNTTVSNDMQTVQPLPGICQYSPGCVRYWVQFPS